MTQSPFNVKLTFILINLRTLRILKDLERFLKLNSSLYAHFAIEFLVLLVLGFTIAANINLRLAVAKSQTLNRSLFFSTLKNHPQLNIRLVETYESVNLKLAGSAPLDEKQVLAASTKNKEESSQVSAPLPTLSGTALLKPNPASSSGLPMKRDTEVYTVRGGDTVARIASAFGVSPETIKTANNLSSDLIKPEQTLVIPPMSGILHTVQKGETISSIAKKYGLPDPELILEFNEIEIEDFIVAGDEIFIPNGVKVAPPTPARRQYLADLQREDIKQVVPPSNYRAGLSGFVWPMPGAARISQQFWRRHLAIDIPGSHYNIVAAADGVVVLSGWQRGYGYTIVVDHGNGYRTRYAHASKLLVGAGAHVSQGQTIMLSGSTGRSSGPHLHFEILKNGAHINPLSVVRR